MIVITITIINNKISRNSVVGNDSNGGDRRISILGNVRYVIVTVHAKTTSLVFKRSREQTEWFSPRHCDRFVPFMIAKVELVAKTQRGKEYHTSKREMSFKRPFCKKRHE